MSALRNGRLQELVLMVLCVMPHTSRSQNSFPPILVEIRAAAEKGTPEAQARLGNEFRIRNDTASAIKWYSLAADQGLPKAQYELGLLLIPTNPMDAFRWIQKGAEKGYVHAQVSLAGYYRDGRMVRRNPTEAYVWYSMAAVQNHEKAALERDSLILRMTSKELADGQRRLAGLVPPGSPAALALALMGTYPTNLPNAALATKVDVNHLTLKGLTISKSRRSAIINDKIFEPGDEISVKSGTLTTLVRCLEIRPNSVLVAVNGAPDSYELFMH